MDVLTAKEFEEQCKQLIAIITVASILVMAVIKIFVMFAFFQRWKNYSAILIHTQPFEWLRMSFFTLGFCGWNQIKGIPITVRLKQLHLNWLTPSIRINRYFLFSKGLFSFELGSRRRSSHWLTPLAATARQRKHINRVGPRPAVEK